MSASTSQSQSTFIAKSNSPTEAVAMAEAEQPPASPASAAAGEQEAAASPGAATRSIAQIAQGVVRRFRRYADLVGWVSAASLWRFRWMTVAILGSGLAALAGHAASITIIARYAHLQENDLSVTLLGTVFRARTSFALLAICAAAIMASLLIAAIFTHVADRLAIRLRRRFQDHCTALAYSRLAAGFHVLPTGSGAAADVGDIMRIVRSDAGINGRIASMLVTAVTPAITTVLAMAAMFLLNATATLMIVALLLVSAVFLYRANIAAARASRDFERLAPAASSGFRRHIHDLRDAPQHAVVDHGNDPLPFDEAGMRDYLDARDRRMMAVKTSRLISDVTIAIIMCIILLTLGIGLIRQGSGWGLLLAYLIVVRHALTNFRTTTSTLISINRFYPQLRRYRDFIEATQPRDGAALAPEHYVIRLGAQSLEGSLESAEIKPGDRALLLCAAPPNRYTAGFLMDVLVGSSRQAWLAATHSLRFVNVRQVIDERRALADQFGLPRGIQAGELAAMLGADDVPEDWLEVLPTSFDQALGAEQWQAVPRGAKAAIAAVAAAKSDAQWILIDHAALEHVPDSVRAGVVELLADRIVVVVSREVESVAHMEASLVIVADQDEVVGIGTQEWVAPHLPAISGLLERTQPARQAMADLEIDDDDLVE